MKQEFVEPACSLASVCIDDHTAFFVFCFLVSRRCAQFMGVFDCLFRFLQRRSDVPTTLKLQASPIFEAIFIVSRRTNSDR